MRSGSRILLVLLFVIIILIAAAVLLINGGGLLNRPGTATPPPVSIVIAAQPIQRDSQITADALSTMQISRDQLTDKMITSNDQVVGKYAAYPLAQGIPITVDMISDRPGINQPGSEAARVISPGLVAVSIPISRLDAVGYAIKDGDHVNVIATTLFVDVDSTFQSVLPNDTAVVTGTGFVQNQLPLLSAQVAGGGNASAQGRAELDPTLNQALYLVPSESQRPRLVSQMILQDIQVLHLGDFTTTSQDQTQATPTPAPGQNAPVVVAKPDIVTLIVAPQDAVTLTYLVSSGAKLTLALRAPDDTSRVETEAATLQYLLSQYAVPVPAKLPYAMDPRVDTLNPTPSPTP